MIRTRATRNNDKRRGKCSWKKKIKSDFRSVRNRSCTCTHKESGIHFVEVHNFFLLVYIECCWLLLVFIFLHRHSGYAFAIFALYSHRSQIRWTLKESSRFLLRFWIMGKNGWKTCTYLLSDALVRQTQCVCRSVHSIQLSWPSIFSQHLRMLNKTCNKCYHLRGIGFCWSKFPLLVQRMFCKQ